MLFKQGSYVGNGTRQFIDIGFRLRAIIWKGDSTLYMGSKFPSSWVGRSNVLGTSDSYIDGVRENDTGFYVGSNATCNTLGVTYYWMAFGEDSSGDFDDTSWCGNQTAGRTITLKSGMLPEASIVKRDSTRDGVLTITGSATRFMQGSTPSECVAFTAPGTVTLTAAVECNEYDSAGGLGEGIDGIFFKSSANCKIVTWLGDGVAGRRIATGLANPAGAMINNHAVGGSCRFATTTMAGKTAPATNGAGLQSNEISFDGRDLVIGTTLTHNLAGTTYGAIVWEEKTTGEKVRTPYFKVKNKQAVYLQAGGVASYINCGSSDATLLINGAISYEFFGAVAHNASPTLIVDAPIIVRGNGPYGIASGYSFSLLGCAANDASHGWSGVQWAPQIANLMSLAAPLDTSNWRTGILAPFWQLQHVIATLDTDGAAMLYVNGKLEKQRKLATSTLAGVAGHPTIIGARSSSGSIVRNTRLMLREMAIYNRALSADEALARYERSALGSTVADVTSGRAAWWNADNAGGALIPDAVNSANNGTINAGVILTL